MAAERILVVDDEPGVRDALEGILSDEGFRVATAGSGEEGLAALEREPFDALLLDVWLPGIDGLDTLRRVRELQLDTQVVMISGHGTIETAVRATKLGAFDFVEKPLSLEKTLLVLRNALRQHRLERRNRHLVEQLARDTEILGQSVAAARLRHDVEAASEARSPVLILGEPGSGRETVARRLHATGATREGPFVEVPCAALDPAASAAALWGDHDRAGEESARPGRLELARGGMLFLDDVDRLEAGLQRRLAGALAEAVRCEPGLRPVASAAGETLQAELQQVLAVLTIRVPPLRERREDIPLIAERFMRELALEYARPPKRLGAEALAALRAWAWPGNIRELRNLIERLLVVTERDVIERSDLPQGLGGAGPATEDLYREFPSLADGLEAFERYYVRRVLADEGADRPAAARRLGMTEAELRRRLREGGR